MKHRRIIPKGSKVPLRLTEAECRLIEEETFADPELLDLVRDAQGKGRTRCVLLTLDDAEDLEGWVAAASNHCEDRRLGARLDRIYEKVRRILEVYTDEDPAGR